MIFKPESIVHILRHISLPHEFPAREPPPPAHARLPFLDELYRTYVSVFKNDFGLRGRAADKNHIRIYWGFPTWLANEKSDRGNPGYYEAGGALKVTCCRVSTGAASTPRPVGRSTGSTETSHARSSCC